ncbi:uncharacterized protein LOC126740128 isoform X2 [Anthonomus grandis grandis]|nr:uncharacterized protein LOC126740128 isoform X2 [Anthonomus grandis grandis]
MDMQQIVTDGDHEWNNFFQNALQADPKLEYKENNPCFSYSENGVDFEVTKHEQERYFAFLSKIQEVYAKLNYWPSPKQKMLVLAISAHISQNEKNFLQMSTTGIYKTLIQMAEVSEPATDCLVKVRYMDMLCSFFEHNAGLRWSLENNHWTQIYDLVLNCQGMSSCVAERVYTTLCQFLQKTSRVAPKVCLHVIKQMIQTPVATAHKHLPKTRKNPIELINNQELTDLMPAMTCLVETLERLLASAVPETLKFFLKLQVREASDTLAILSNDSGMSLQLNRVLIILSFYEMTELFDGIKVVNHDPIALSGFLRIIERELRKSHLETIYELYYYALKYWKNVCRKMPQYFLKEKPIDIENELMSFQVEPLVIIGEKILGVPQTSEEELRKCHLSDLLNMYSQDCLQLGYEIREQIVKCPLSIEMKALKTIIKSKSMYSRKNMAIVFQSMIYSLRDFIKYLKRISIHGAIKNDDLLADSLLEAILVYLENFDLSWRESIGSIELANLVYEFLYYYTNCSAEITLKALKALNITISKHMSPNMALLVDNSNTSINDLGSMLFDKCFNCDPEVRNASLIVVCTICQKVNKGFSSYKIILEEFLTHDLILTMTLTDSDRSVKATALKCLQEMIKMEDIGEKILGGHLLDKILKLILKEEEPVIIREAITLITQIYKSEWNTKEDKSKMHNVMVKVALREKTQDVQEQTVTFWEHVTVKHLEKQGMADGEFPSVIFSKEHKKIIRMDDKEIRKRLFQALDAMSKSGCFGIFQHYLQAEGVPKSVYSTTTGIVVKLLRLLKQYEVTPEFILFNQTYPNLWSIPNNIYQSPSINDDEHMQEIIEETVMEMINGSMTPVYKSFHGGDMGEATLSERNSGQVSTVDFMDFIYKRLPHLTD